MPAPTPEQKRTPGPGDVRFSTAIPQNSSDCSSPCFMEQHLQVCPAFTDVALDLLTLKMNQPKLMEAR